MQSRAIKEGATLDGLSEEERIAKRRLHFTFSFESVLNRTSLVPQPRVAYLARIHSVSACMCPHRRLHAHACLPVRSATLLCPVIA